MTKPNILAYQSNRAEYDRGTNQFCLRDSATVIIGITDENQQQRKSNAGLVIPLVRGFIVSASMDTGLRQNTLIHKPRAIEALVLDEDFNEVVKGNRTQNKLLELLLPARYSPALAAASLSCFTAFQAYSQEQCRIDMQY